MDRLLQNARQTVGITIRDSNGAAVDANGDVTFTVQDSGGAILTSGTAAKPANTVGIYQVSLTNLQTAVLDGYKVIWTAEVGGGANTYTTRYEVVGGFLFGIAELRAFDSVLEDVVVYTPAKILAAREYVEERLEELCGIAFVPRGRRISIDGNGHGHAVIPDLYPRRLVSASIDPGSGPVVLTATELTQTKLYDSGVLKRTKDGQAWDVGHGNVELFYEYGLDQAPEPVRRAAMLMARRYLVKTPLPSDYVTSYSDGSGTFRLSIEGRDGPTGIPEVDAVIASYSHEMPAVG